MRDYQQSTTEELGDIEVELSCIADALSDTNTLLERIANALEASNEND
jgi:hypothetical protein